MIKAAILTISDTRSKETDESGKVIKKLLLENSNFKIAAYELVKDEKREIKNKIIYFTDELKVDIVLTNGGTGFGPRDVTPEATAELIEKPAPGISEWIRMAAAKENKKAILSRGVAGLRKKSLLINLPGSPRGSRESLVLILDIIPHALEMLQGKGHRQ